MDKGPQLNQIQTFSMDSLHDEILDVHIFSKFNLFYWMKHIVPVCRRWRQICKRSNHIHKQLTFRPITSRKKALRLIEEYQPTAIQIEHRVIADPLLSIKDLDLFVRTSKRCHTLVIPFPIIIDESDKYIEEVNLSQITTLSIHNDDFHCTKYFRKLKNLQILYPKLSVGHYCIPSTVTYLSVYGSALNVDRRESVIKNWCKNGNADPVIFFSPTLDTVPDMDSSLSYEQWAYQWKITKAAKLANEEEFDSVLKLFQTGETSLQIELDLEFKREYVYDYIMPIYPFVIDYSQIKRPIKTIFNCGQKYYDRNTELSRILYEQLNTCSIEVPFDIKYALVNKWGNPHELIQMFKEIHSAHPDTDDWHFIYEVLNRDDLYCLLLTDDTHRRYVQELISEKWIGKGIILHSKSAESFQRLIKFIEWRSLLPRMDSSIIKYPFKFVLAVLLFLIILFIVIPTKSERTGYIIGIALLCIFLAIGIFL